MSGWLGGLGNDVRYALRQMRRAPGFALTTVLTLGLGIGGTAAMYSVVRDVLLTPLPFAERDRLVGVAFTTPQAEPTAKETGRTAEFVQERAGGFDSFGLSDYGAIGVNLSAPGRAAVPVSSIHVSRGFFPTLGVQPILGRSFTAEEDVAGGPKVAMLNFWVWRRVFGGDPGVVNRVVRINEEPYTIVGVLPEAFSGRGVGETALSGDMGVWLPLQMSGKTPGYDGTNFMAVGRLRRGVSVGQAQAELDGMGESFYRENPSYLGWVKKIGHPLGFRVWPLQAVMVSDVRRSLLVLLGAVVAVLLVACLNLAGLMTARAATRGRELALRAALGASRGDVLRLLVCESLVLAFAGSLLGLGFSALAKPALLGGAPMAIPRMHMGGGSWAVAGFVLALACVTTLVCGLLPAWAVARRDPSLTLKGGQAAGSDRTQVRLGKGLIVGQVGVAMVLLSTASLLLACFVQLRSIASGVEPRRLEVAQVTLKGAAYEKTAATAGFVEKVLASLRNAPGVESAAAVNGLPLDAGLNEGGKPAGRPELAQNIEFRAISPGYFRTMCIPVMAGRDVGEDDREGTPAVAVVNEAAAKKWWPGRLAIGERVDLGGGEMRTVVGVVADTRNHSLAEPVDVMIYAPIAQMTDGSTKMVNGWFPTSFAIRLAGDFDVDGMVRKAVSDADPEMPVAKLSTMQAFLDDTVAAPRFFSWMAGGFAGFALLLTVIGLFGLLSYQVTQRTREIGVRLALGASRGGVFRLILERGMLLVGVGLALGAVASSAVPRVVRSVLEDYVYTDGAGLHSPASLTIMAVGAAALAMLVAAAMASYLPARRAAAVEPMEALRAE